MKKTILTIISALMLCSAATAAAQDNDIETELETTSEWTTDVQPTWTERIVEGWWQSSGSSEGSGSGSGD